MEFCLAIKGSTQTYSLPGVDQMTGYLNSGLNVMRILFPRTGSSKPMVGFRSFLRGEIAVFLLDGELIARQDAGKAHLEVMG